MTLASHYRIIENERTLRGFTNRARGHAFERKVFNAEKLNSLYAIHSNGSFGPFDIVSFKKTGKIWFISCKANGYFEPKEIERLNKYKLKIKSKYKDSCFKMAYYINRKHYVYEGL